jgi:hypothetical protein
MTGKAGDHVFIRGIIQDVKGNDAQVATARPHAAHDSTQTDPPRITRVWVPAEDVLPITEEYDRGHAAGVAHQAVIDAMRRAPIDLILFCPKCDERHVDVGEFATKLHHTHSCQGCGFSWRPAIVSTRGVQFLPGFKNELSPVPAVDRVAMPCVACGGPTLYRLLGKPCCGSKKDCEARVRGFLPEPTEDPRLKASFGTNCRGQKCGVCAACQEEDDKKLEELDEPLLPPERDLDEEELRTKAADIYHELETQCTIPPEYEVTVVLERSMRELAFNARVDERSKCRQLCMKLGGELSQQGKDEAQASYAAFLCAGKIAQRMKDIEGEEDDDQG